MIDLHIYTSREEYLAESATQHAIIQEDELTEELLDFMETYYGASEYIVVIEGSP